MDDNLSSFCSISLLSSLDSAGILNDDKLIFTRTENESSKSFASTVKNVKQYAIDTVNFDIADNKTVVVKNDLIMLGKIGISLIYEDDLQNKAIGNLAMRSLDSLKLKSMSHYGLSSISKEDYEALEHKDSNTIFFVLPEVMSYTITFMIDDNTYFKFVDTDANTITKKIKAGYLIGSFPKLSQSKDVFLYAWRIKPSNELVTESDIPKSDIVVCPVVSLLMNVTLCFKPNGGKIYSGDTSISMTARSEIGDRLPLAYKEQHEFLGWFTLPTNGTLITSSTKVSLDTPGINVYYGYMIYYYAHYQEISTL